MANLRNTIKDKCLKADNLYNICYKFKPSSETHTQIILSSSCPIMVTIYHTTYKGGIYPLLWPPTQYTGSVMESTPNHPRKPLMKLLYHHCHIYPPHKIISVPGMTYPYNTLVHIHLPPLWTTTTTLFLPLTSYFNATVWTPLKNV